MEVQKLRPEERTCPEYGVVMDEIGKETVRTLEIIPPKFIVHEDRNMTYACKNYSGKNEANDFQTQIKKTPHVPNVIKIS